MSTRAFRTDKHILDLRPQTGEPFLAYAKRYTLAPEENRDPPSVDRTRFTLIFLHALSYHKELWEPTISHLFEIERVAGNTPGAPHIGEVWTIDGADHGESVFLNEATLAADTARISCRSYGNFTLALLQSGLLDTAQPSKVIVVGHSAGGISGILATDVFSSPRQIPWAAFILVEPWMIAPEIEKHPDMVKVTTELVRSSLLRRDIWDSREEAHAYLKSKSAWRIWDTRALELYVEYGLRPLPSREYPTLTSGVTLSLPRKLESHGYGDVSEQQASLVRMNEICDVVPMHAVFGEAHPKIVKTMQRKVCEYGKGMASIAYLPKTGHMAPQQSPELVAGAIWDVLRNPTGRLGLREKL